MERRQHRRYPAWLEATVISREGLEQAATIWDLSVAGVALEMANPPALGPFSLELQWDGTLYRFDCERTEHAEPASRVIGAKFVDVSARGKAALESIVGAARAEFDQAQRRFAGGRPAA